MMNNIMILLLKLVWLFLHYRSPYLRRILSTNEKKNDGTLAHIKLSNISSNNFKVYLWWKLSLIDYDNSDVIKVLVAASELSLHELSQLRYSNHQISLQFPEKLLISIIQNDNLQISEIHFDVKECEVFQIDSH
ncbi:BTB/POZ protein [Rhizophagus irregularis DAOM 181602=DAOM 197198]|uniref:Uncharacterized protein n=1 Tax=Rhizophagus irregularis (strain DAOM 181602 / DAOM 197198 / MUCL 43194) TaxID=747089 RepID=A0A2P4PE78_RHIID|nr:hypothetical protein GLOIN_2v1881958 [Rhizophagus irregularis DAOM 181602=DAOM 197198]POG63677.1 hypothetical protein GLOIN_2v1881958 [Rhizophagus irregularis DAOM 181602=DAOM 197198]GET60367.1 BTB/POZ protein [Rhizophagus irregularis DAOM 181602=DAOM 197198]|eukprot:XP_025170543.1 hypothetical protein GLOIN_2v1881958 [Rhizophagus irregularis DAOM 181602=DAOM 197198]